MKSTALTLGETGLLLNGEAWRWSRFTPMRALGLKTVSALLVASCCQARKPDSRRCDVG